MTHTIGEALDRFTLVQGAGSESNGTACAMTALAWVAGEAWTDSPACAHPILARWVIRANDHPDTTEDERCQLVIAGESGVIDTWWVPAEVLLSAWANASGDRVARMLGVLNAVAEWKGTTPKPRADLRGANLRDANLRGADLGGANLRGADLWGADLWGADLWGANLRGANLRGADLRGADLWGADLWGADLWGADLRGADLGGANLRGADLWGADLWGANLGGADRPSWLPEKWAVSPESPHRIVKAQP